MFFAETLQEITGKDAWQHLVITNELQYILYGIDFWHFAYFKRSCKQQDNDLQMQTRVFDIYCFPHSPVLRTKETHNQNSVIRNMTILHLSERQQHYRFIDERVRWSSPDYTEMLLHITSIWCNLKKSMPPFFTFILGRTKELHPIFMFWMLTPFNIFAFITLVIRLRWKNNNMDTVITSFIIYCG